MLLPLRSVLVTLVVSQPGVYAGACKAAGRTECADFPCFFQKLKAVTITTEAAVIPALKWKTDTNVNAQGGLFCQKTTTLAKVGQQNLSDSFCSVDVKSMFEGTFLRVFIVFS